MLTRPVQNPYADRSLGEGDGNWLGSNLTKQVLVVVGISALLIGASFLAKKR